MDRPTDTPHFCARCGFDVDHDADEVGRLLREVRERWPNCEITFSPQRFDYSSAGMIALAEGEYGDRLGVGKGHGEAAALRALLEGD